MNKYKVALFVCAFVWGFGYVAMDHLIDTSSPTVAVGLRFTIASGFIYIYKFKRINETFMKNLKPICILGIALFSAFLFQTYGLSLTTTAKNAFLTATNVIWTPILLAMFWGFKIPRRIILASVIMIVGIGFVSLDGISAPNIGDSLTLIGAVFFALHIVLIGKLANDDNLEAIVFGQLFVTGVLGLSAAVITDSFIIVPNLEFAVSLGFAALFSTALCFFLQNYGISKVESSVGALILSLEAMFGVMAAIVIDGDPVNIITIVGFIIMFTSILIAEKQ